MLIGIESNPLQKLEEEKKITLKCIQYANVNKVDVASTIKEEKSSGKKKKRYSNSKTLMPSSFPKDNPPQ